MLLQVRLSLLILVHVIISLACSVDTDRLGVIHLILRWCPLTTAVVAMRCVSMSLRRLSLHAWHHRGVLLILNSLILCGLASNNWTTSISHLPKHQIVEIWWLARLLISGGLWAGSNILCDLNLVLNDQWRMRLLHVRWRTSWVSSVFFGRFSLVLIRETNSSVAAWCDLVILWTSVLMHLGIASASFWLLNVSVLLWDAWVLSRAGPLWLNEVSWILINLDS